VGPALLAAHVLGERRSPGRSLGQRGRSSLGLLGAVGLLGSAVLLL
jgi:hypothetical protein